MDVGRITEPWGGLICSSNPSYRKVREVRCCAGDIKKMWSLKYIGCDTIIRCAVTSVQKLHLQNKEDRTPKKHKTPYRSWLLVTAGPYSFRELTEDKPIGDIHIKEDHVSGWMTQSMYGEHMDAYLEAIRGFLFFFKRMAAFDWWWTASGEIPLRTAMDE